MDLIQFDRQYDIDRRAIYIVAFVQFGALIANSVILLAGLQSLRSLALIISVVALLMTSILALFLYLRFRSTPAARDKYQLLHQLKRVRGNIRAAETRADQALRMRDSIVDNERSALAARQEAHDRKVAGIHAHRASTQATRGAEMTAALKRMQDEYIRSGLENQAIKNEKISGIGPKLKDRLAGYGVVYAVDVSRARISEISGFGEAKITSLLTWRRGIETLLEASKPTNIPADDETRIREQYAT